MAGLTPWDTFFVVLAVVEVICVAAMAYVLTMFMQTARKGQRRVQPLVREAIGLKQLAQAMAQHTQAQAGGVAGRVRTVTALVKRRLETTQKIAREVIPPAQKAAAEAREVQVDLSRKAQVLGDMARRLGRVKAAATAASTASTAAAAASPAAASATAPEPRERAGVG